jgi:serine/threonine protein kinase/Tfp pilus assembly protein PilF
LIGKTVSHYKITEKIGKGGMGVVYKAQDLKLDRFVALKFLPPHLTTSDEEKQRFIYEAKAASSLDHTNICAIYEIDETEDDQLFISMAYYDGETLDKKIKGERLKIKDVIDYTIQIAQGLAKAHEKGIVHRDIKPANIMLTKDGEVKILDFGLAKLAGRTMLTKEGMTLGTISYMSPEQTQGTDIDQRTDIWALGVILYEMLTGERPFKGDYDQAILYSILNEEPDPISNVSPEVPNSIEQIVAKALEKKPDARYQQVEELLDDLKSISAGIVPDEIKVRLMKEKLRRRKRTILYTGAAGLIILLVVIALQFFSGGAEVIDSIAVLPLENLTGNADQDYFVDGATDELIGQLAQISELRVISRQSVMRYKESDKSLPEIARELNVDAIVEGTVYQVGESVRIRVQLSDALPEEQNLWTQTYERVMSDVLVMYSEMARTIADKIQIKLTTEEMMRFTGARKVNPDAYEAYLKGRSYWYKLASNELELAMQNFELALKIDPNYALAYTGVALVWIGRYQMNLAPRNEAVPLAKVAAEKAVELDSTLAEAHYALALFRTWSEWDWDNAEISFKKAIQLNPNFPDVHAYYSHFLSHMGRTDEAISHIERAIEMDPFNALFHGLYGVVLAYQRRYDEAMSAAQAGLAIQHTSVARVALQYGLIAKGMHEEQMAIQRARIALDPERVAAFERGLEQSGYQGAQRGIADVLAARYGKDGKFVFRGQVIALRYLDAGDNDKAIDWLEKAYEDHDPNMPYINLPIFWDPLHSYPRYQNLLRKMGLPLQESSTLP